MARIISREKIIEVISNHTKKNGVEFIVDKEIEKIIYGMELTYYTNEVEKPHILLDFAREMRDLINENARIAQVLNEPTENVKPPKAYHIQLFNLLKDYYGKHL